MKRRDFLAAAGTAGAIAVSGCTFLRPATTEVDITLMNFCDEERTASVVVKQDDREVFRTEKTIPAAEPEGPAETLQIPNAFEGADDEQFTVAVMPKSQQTDTHDYKITCVNFDTNDTFSVWILNPETNEEGKRTDLTAAYCSDA
ncbi:MAG: hypothetical protein U5K70_02835 [Halodesulfurarchaeum sp.]|nr:hypothetical protein [Halodesulfurarchaeum sp.]